MLSLLLLSLPAVVQEPAPAAEAPAQAAAESEAMAKLRERVDGLAGAKSYAFRVLNTSESSGMGGGRGGFGGRGGQQGNTDRPQRGQGQGQGGGDRPQRGEGQGQGGAERPAQDAAPAAQEPEAPQPWEGIYQAGKPIMMKRGDLHVARNDQGRMAMKSGEGAWAVAAMPGRGQGGRGQGGARGGAGMDRNQMRAMFEARGVQLPHQTLAALLESIDGEKLVREEKLGGIIVFHGPLTEEGAMRMAMGGRSMGRGFGGRGGDQGEDGPQMLSKGTARIAFGPKGEVVDILVEAEMMGTFGEREFTRSSRNEIRAHKIGAAEAEIPAAATRALAQDPALEEEF